MGLKVINIRIVDSFLFQTCKLLSGRLTVFRGSRITFFLMCSMLIQGISWITWRMAFYKLCDSKNKFLMVAEGKALQYQHFLDSITHLCSFILELGEFNDTCNNRLSPTHYRLSFSSAAFSAWEQTLSGLSFRFHPVYVTKLYIDLCSADSAP